MVTIDLKGLHTVKAKGRAYYYAWRGGPRIATTAEPGTPAFMAAYNEAVAEARAPDQKKFRAVIVDYKRQAFPQLAPSTRDVWSPWLDRIETYFGKLSTAQFDRPQKIRPIIRRWRDGYRETPRAADMGLQVLSRVLSHAVDQGRIASNPCEGIAPLYTGDRSAIIWLDADIAQLKKTCSKEIGWAVDLAAHTGLRVSDLIRLSWTHVEDEAIVISTGKSKHRREAIIPLYGALRELLGRIPRRKATTILTNTHHRPWTRDGLGSSFNKAKIKAGLEERDLHFHDLRGTAATKFYIAGLKMRVIAEIMGWEEEHVERIIRRYVTRGAAIRAAIRQLDGTGR